MLRWTGIAWLWREIAVAHRTTVLAYHEIGPETLDRHLSVLETRYNIISLRQFLDAVGTAGRSLPNKPLIITFDDGRAADRELLSVFRKHGVKPTIFLTSGLIGTNRAYWTTIPGSRALTEHLKRVPDSERVSALEAMGHTDTTEYSSPSALSRSDIDAMRDEVDFQAHTVFHPVLSQCSDERSRHEIAECKRQLEEDLGLDIYAFAYPNGRTGFFLDRDVDNVRNAGYACAFSVDPGTVGEGSDMFRLPRYTVSEEASASEVIVRASGVAHRLKRLAGE